MGITLEQYHDMLSKLVGETANLTERLLVLPANELRAGIDFRITQTGMGTNGKLETYSRKKWFATAENFDNKSNFKPKTTKSGRVRKSVTLEEGYLELRKLQGYRVDITNFERTGAGIKNIKVGNETDTSVAIGFTDLKQSIKFRGYEKRKGVPVLEPTSEEIQNVAKAQAMEYSLFIKEVFTK